MVKRTMYSLVRKDTKQILDKRQFLSWTKVDYCKALSGLLERGDMKYIALQLNCNERALKRMAKFYKLPNEKQCEAIRRLINEGN